MWKEKILLQHVADASRSGGNILIFQIYFSLIWSDNTGKHIEQCGLSGTAGAYDYCKFALLNVEGHSVCGVNGFELAAQTTKDFIPAAEILQKVGLGERLQNFPAQLSGGEQQRVSIARALAKNPKLLLCDEPTGALDYKTGKQVLALLQDTCRRTGRTVIVITHNTALTAMADRIIQVRSGKIVSNQVNEHPVPVQEIEW